MQSYLSVFQDGRSSLFIACVHNKTDVMQILIDEGADVNVQEEVIIIPVFYLGIEI